MLVLTTLWGCGDDPGKGRGDGDDDPTVEETGDTGTPTSPETHTGEPPPEDPCVWLPSRRLGPLEGCDARLLLADAAVTNLVVDAGTVLEVAPDVVLRVDGSLVAEGTAARPIVLRSTGDGPWGGLQLLYVADETYYWNYDTWPPGPQDGDADFVLHHVEVVDAGGGRDAAITVDGGYTQCGYYSCTTRPSTILARELTLRGSMSMGIAGGGWIRPDDPVGFEDVAGYLVDTPGDGLRAALVEDLGGNLTPAIRVHPSETRSGLWVSQAVPLDMATDLYRRAFDGYGGPVRDEIVIEPNVVRFPAGLGVIGYGGVIRATGVTFSALDPAQPWAGIAAERDFVGGYGRIPTSLSLVDCVVEGASSPAVDWLRSTEGPALTGNTIRDVSAAGQSVCVASCLGVDDAAAENTLSCDVPVLCPQ